TGTNDADFLQGLGGNDFLFGQAGDDVLDGGTGNDLLFGGRQFSSGIGNDTYIFGRGYGQDTITDNDTTLVNLDTIKLAADIAPSDVTLSRDPLIPSDLVVSING